MEYFVAGRRVVGMVTACTVEPLFTALAAFHHELPGSASVSSRTPPTAWSTRVRSGTADLALVAAAAEPAPTSRSRRPRPPPSWTSPAGDSAFGAGA